MEIAFPALAALFAFVLVLLLSVQFRDQLARSAQSFADSSAPVIGAGIRAVGRGLLSIVRWIDRAADAGVKIIERWFLSVAQVVIQPIEAIVDAVRATAQRVAYDVAHTIPRLFHAIETEARRATHALSAAVADLRGFATGVERRLTQRIESGLRWVERTLVAPLHNALRAAIDWIRGEVIPRIDERIDETARDAAREIERVQEGLRDQLGKIEHSLGGEIAGLAAALAALSALTRAIEADVASPLRGCVPSLTRLCANLGGLLQILELLAGGVIGFRFAEGVTRSMVAGFGEVENIFERFLAS